ncbi:hypothetical protein HHK36_033390 [Tetracentron sinense]|uniref:Uncharacterized protein n=1 Tax=Tetracentron sinense TaxID=13715 RepID=A0A835CWU7_TETSI|nr:hypothetical protein HHK36_033390 [Tetracentron sinense]
MSTTARAATGPTRAVNTSSHISQASRRTPNGLLFACMHESDGTLTVERSLLVKSSCRRFSDTSSGISWCMDDPALRASRTGNCWGTTYHASKIRLQGEDFGTLNLYSRHKENLVFNPDHGKLIFICFIFYTLEFTGFPLIILHSSDMVILNAESDFINLARGDAFCNSHGDLGD